MTFCFKQSILTCKQGINNHPIKNDMMRDSKNSAIGKVIFTGTQLAQAKLLGITADTNNPNPNELQEKIEANTQAKIFLYPCFSEAKVQNSNVLAEVQNYIQAKSKELNAEFDKVELELFAKAE